MRDLLIHSRKSSILFAAALVFGVCTASADASPTGKKARAATMSLGTGSGVIQGVSAKSQPHFQAEAPRPESVGNAVQGSQIFPVPQLEEIKLSYTPSGEVLLDHLPSFKSSFGGRVTGITPSKEFVYYSIDAVLQEAAERIVSRAHASHVALVAMEPATGRVLAMASRSKTIPDLSLHSGFPAASIFKIVTAAAAVERASIVPTSTIRFRGGTYTLNQWNYKPDRKRDRRYMTVAEALGRSCNPVFGRIGLEYLNGDILRRYTRNFGFNSDLGFDVPLHASEAAIYDDEYKVSLTAAGFGEVHLSPVHAATMVSGLANDGLMPRPILIDRVVAKSGEVVYQAQPATLGRIVQPATAKRLLEMMEYTTTMGTSRKQFFRGGRAALPGIAVAAKTGTLRGEDPQGINNWFVATAPLDQPKIALAVIVVDPVHVSTKASELGRQLLQTYLLKSADISSVSPTITIRKTSLKKRVHRRTR